MALNLLKLTSSTLLTLPASSFPTPADAYVCDKCHRDVTKRFHRDRPHVWHAMGPSRYRCVRCQEYPTGATEWDHLGQWERTHRASEMLGTGTLFSAPFLGLGLLIYFAMSPSKAVLIGVFALSACPFLLLNLPFWFAVAASIWRTRVSGKPPSPET